MIIWQITDMHLFLDDDARLVGVNTTDTFNTVWQEALKYPKPDLILFTGDLTHDHKSETYDKLASLVVDSPAPIALLAGNHDEGSLLTKLRSLKPFIQDEIIDIGTWRIIMLDSHIDGAVAGSISTTEFIKLEKALATNKNLLVAYHHHPVDINCKWLAPLGIANAGAFEDILKVDNLRLSIFGHIHQEFVGEFAGAPCYATPATSIQFKPESDEFALDKVAPGFRIFDLSDDGSFSTEVVRIDYVPSFDEQSQGYE